MSDILQGYREETHNIPRCGIEGCHRLAQHQSRRTDGSIRYRKRHGIYVCGIHHKEYYNLDGHGVTGYKQYKLTYCENIDGRLGYFCTTTIVDECQLSVDHKNGVSHDHRRENCQTFCLSCHAFKTKINKDSLSEHSRWARYHPKRDVSMDILGF